MLFSLDTLSPQTMKAEARVLREESAARGQTISHSQALEQVARSHGYRDWNTARAALPERISCPVSIGQRVTGTYLKQPFTGTVLGASVQPGSQIFRVTIQLDEAVDVVTFDSFSNMRHRISCRLNAYGTSPAYTSDGHPHMQLDIPVPGRVAHSAQGTPPA